MLEIERLVVVVKRPSNGTGQLSGQASSDLLEKGKDVNDYQTTGI